MKEGNEQNDHDLFQNPSRSQIIPELTLPAASGAMGYMIETESHKAL